MDRFRADNDAILASLDHRWSGLQVSTAARACRPTSSAAPAPGWN